MHGEAILLAPLFPHYPFSENPFSDLREGVTTPNNDPSLLLLTLTLITLALRLSRFLEQ